MRALAESQIWLSSNPNSGTGYFVPLLQRAGVCWCCDSWDSQLAAVAARKILRPLVRGLRSRSHYWNKASASQSRWPLLVGPWACTGGAVIDDQTGSAVAACGRPARAVRNVDHRSLNQNSNRSRGILRDSQGGRGAHKAGPLAARKRAYEAACVHFWPIRSKHCRKGAGAAWSPRTSPSTCGLGEAVTRRGNEAIKAHAATNHCGASRTSH